MGEEILKQQCGDWRLEREIGQGAYGVVYLAVGSDGVRAAVKVCRRDISKKLLKGFMMAPWASCDTQEHLDFNLKGIDLFAEALKA